MQLKVAIIKYFCISFIFRFGSSLCFRGLDAMGRRRETSLQELANTKNGFPLLAVAWGNP